MGGCVLPLHAAPSAPLGHLDTGSLMPRGLTAVLSRQQQLDLVRYLSDLGKIR